MSYYSYTILKCTNPELISSGSTFVNNSYSLLLKVEDGASHFSTRNATMEREIFELSKLYPEEIITADWYWDEDFDDCIQFSFSCKNGKFKELGIEPLYMFFYPTNISINKDEKSAFENHVLEYLKRLDIIKKKRGRFTLDILNNEKDRYGYESYITITYFNDSYKWTAKRTGTTFILVTIEKRETKAYRVKEVEDKNRIDEYGEYADLPEAVQKSVSKLSNKIKHNFDYGTKETIEKATLGGSHT